MIYTSSAANGPEYELRYYTTADEDCPVQKLLDAMPPKHAAKVGKFFKLLEEKGPVLPRPYADAVRGKIRELVVDIQEDAAIGDREGRAIHERLAQEDSGMRGKSRMGVLFRDDLKERLKDPEFAKGYAEVDAEVRLAVAVAEARERAGMTQAELAKKMQTKQSNISRIERGTHNLTVATLEKIAKALHSRLEIRLRPL